MRDVYLHALFSPNAIAVVGSFDSAGATARVILSNLEGWGYQGRIVAVNWTGQPPSQDLQEMEGVDLAVVCLAPELVLDALEMIADKGVKAVIVTSAGFREIGGRGYYLEESIIHLAERRNLTLLGPNCLGVASWDDRLNASLISRLPGQGNIAFFRPRVPCATPFWIGPRARRSDFPNSQASETARSSTRRPCSSSWPKTRKPTSS